MNFNKEITKFLKFVNITLGSKPDWLTDEEIIEEWLQYHWELILEPLLNGKRLEILGSGSDIHPISSRITYPDVFADFFVVCKCLCAGNRSVVNLFSEELVDIADYTFDRFVYWDGNHFSLLGALNSVLLEGANGNLALVDLKEIDFYLERRT